MLMSNKLNYMNEEEYIILQPTLTPLSLAPLPFNKYKLQINSINNSDSNN